MDIIMDLIDFLFFSTNQRLFFMAIEYYGTFHFSIVYP